MPTTASRLEAQLRASEACCDLYVARGTTDLTVAEIASSIGISERTFYRYFPIKAETVTPVFNWTTAAFNEGVTNTPPSEPTTQAAANGFRAALAGEKRPRTEQLFPLVFADAEMWSVFLRKVHDGERTLAPLLSQRVTDPRIAAAAIASATRIALERMVVDGADPEQEFARVLTAFRTGPFG